MKTSNTKKTVSTKKVKNRQKPVTKTVVKIKARQKSKPIPMLVKKRASKQKTNTTQRSKYKAELDALKKETESLKAENLAAMEKYGKLLEVNTSLYLKSDVMLGQIIKALYIMGITPDMIVRKCSEMFQKVEPGKPESGGR